jgi:hypothetical protein
METLPPEGLPTEFTSAQLRFSLHISNSRLEQLAQAGVIARTAKGRYAGDAIRRYVEFLRKAQEGPRDWQAVRTELGREKLALLRLERGQKEGRLLDKDDVRSMNVTIASNVKTRLLNVAPALAPRLTGLRSPAEGQALVDEAICEALTELSNLQFVAG